MAFDVEGARKAGYSEAEIANYLASQKTFDIAGARKAGYGDQEIIGHLLGTQKPKERTYLEAAKDIGAGVVSGAGALTQLPGQLYGLATGDFSDTGLMKVGREIREAGEAMKSEELKRREAERAAKIKEAGKEGEFKAGVTAFMETIKDPALLSNFIAEQAPNLLPGFAVARGLGIAGAGAKTAVAGAVGTGAVQQGADIGAGTYEELYKQMVAKGVPEQEAVGRALGYARATGASAAVISLVAQRLPGGRAIEEAMAKVPIKGGLAARGVAAGKGGLGETFSEMVEEGGGKVAQNLAAQQVDPARSLTEGLGETMGMAAVGGLGLGTAAGLTRGREAPPAEEKPEPEAKLEAPVEPPAKAAPPEAAIPPETLPPSPPPTVQEPPPSDDSIAAMQNYWVGSPADFGMSFADIQNRDRSKPASIQQMTSIAAEPDYNRLSVSRDFGAGAPVVISDVELNPQQLGRIDTVSASDGTKIPVQYAVIDAGFITPSNFADGTAIKRYADPDFQTVRPVAGNGRVAGLQRAFEQNTAQDYVQQMVNDPSHGIDAEAIRGIAQPILVRVMPKSALTPDIADKSNVGGQLGMSPTEQAKIDMGRFDLQGIQFLANGSPSLGSLRQFVAAMPPEEQGNLLNAQGQPNPLAKIRLANALFARAYANDSLIDLYAEATDPEAQQILRGMAIAAPAMSNLSEAGDYDIRPYVTKAAELAVNARRQGMDLAAYIDQGDIDLDPLTREVVSMFAANKNAPRRIGDSLVTLAAEANKAAEQASAPPDMFGEAAFKRPLEDVFAVLRGEPTQAAPVVEEEQPERQDYEIGRSEREIAQEVDGMDVMQVADWLVDNAPNSFAKLVAQAARSRVKAMKDRKIPMTFGLLRGDERKPNILGAVRGLYGRNVKFEMTINAPQEPGYKRAPTGTNYRTLLHEMLHLATQGQIFIDTRKGAKATSGPVYELDNLRKFIMKKVREDKAAGIPVPAMLNKSQTLENVHELISYGMTEIDVQKYLASIDYKKKNAFTRFVDAIRKLLTINKSQQSALERLVALSEEVLEVPAADIQAKYRSAGREFGVSTPSMADTRTPEFRKWFGDSKVVDANGEPLVVYHGSATKGIKVFDTTRVTKRTEKGDLAGTYFTDDKAAAANFAREFGAKAGAPRGEIYAAYIRIENPLNITSAIKKYKKQGMTFGDAKRKALEALTPENDGVIFDGDNFNNSEYIVFKPNQIKSISNLRPTESEVITEERDTRTPEFRKWFGKSKVVDQNGEPRVMYHGTVSDFDTFIPDSHFGTARAANQRARSWSAQNGERPMQIMPVYLRIENPLRVMDNEASDEAALLNAIKRGKYPQLDLGIANRDGAYAAAKAAGYDGLVYQNKVEDRNKLSYVAFDPNQIKSIFNQRPTESRVITEEREPFADISEEKLETPSRIQDKLEEKWDRMRTGAPKEKPSSFSDVDEGLWRDISPVFFPQNKNIVQKLDGMRDRFWQRLAQGVADQYRTIKDYDPIAYMKARMSKTIDGALEGILFNGQVKLTDGALDIAPNTKGLLKVLEPVGNEVDRYQIWVALKRDADLVKQGKAPSVSKDIVRRRNELSAGKIGNKSRLEVYEKVQKDMNELNRSVLRIAYKQGIIDKEAFDVFARDINYIPFYKVMDENGDVQAAATKSGLVNQYFSKALKGGEKPFGDLMENTLRNWSHILSASMKNEAANATIKAAMNVGGAFPNLKVGLEWRLDDEGRNGKVYSAKTGELIGDGSLKPEYTSSDGKGLVKTIIDGKPAYFEVVEPLLLESIMSIGYMGPKSKFIDVARNFKNMLQFGVTLSPAFKIRNLFRDSISAIAVTDLKRNPFANVIEGWTASDRNNPAHISALAGGAIFNFGSAYEGDQSKLIRRLLDQGVKGNTILDNEKKIESGLREAWRAYQEFGNKSESANRMALYKQLRETVNPETNKNYTHLEASFYARDMLDFSMQGAWPAFRLATQVVPFLNARVQGLYKLGRDGIVPTSRVIYNTVTGKPIEATDKQRAEQFSIVMGAVVLASLALYMAFKDDEEFKKREQWDRDNFWWFKLPGMDSALRVPKPFEIGAMGTLAERVVEQIIDQGVEGKVFKDSLSRMLTDTFAVNLPQIVKPLVDLYANKDSFTGAPIETAGMERLSKAERIAERTSPLAIALSQVSNVFLPESKELSPVQVDYAIKAYFGWLGGTISATSHYAVMPFSKSAYPDANWTETMSMGFIKTLPATQSKYVTAFYENNKEISQAYADMRHFAQLGQADKVQEILEEKGDKIAMAKFYDNASKDMAKMRQAIQAIRNDENMTGAQKKEEIDRMKVLIGDLAQQMEEARLMVKKEYAASR